ncbi:Uncharacterised protein [Mycobacteroides abscessus]|nr:Uncharacterised protein [Mycobacteroides abscessus]
MRMADGDLPHPVREPHEVVLPTIFLPAGRQLIVVQLVHQVVHYSAEQVLTAMHVAIQGHSLHTTGRTEPPHGQLIQPLAVHQSYRGIEDLGTRQ